MKKTFLLLTVACAFVSCTKHGDKIDAAKGKLKELGSKYADDMEYVADEILAVDAYKEIVKSQQESSDDMKELGNYKAALEYQHEAGKTLDLAEKAGDKKAYIVKAHQVAAGDTIHKAVFYIDEANHVMDFTIFK